MAINQGNVNFKVTGIGETQSEMKLLPERLVKRALRGATMAAMNIIKKRAKQLAPKSKGQQKKRRKEAGRKSLSVTIISKAKTYSNGGSFVVAGTMGPSYPAGAHGHLLEYGHRIVGHRPNKIDTGKRSKAFPFMAPALKDTEQQVKATYENRLKQFIERYKAAGSG